MANVADAALPHVTITDAGTAVSGTILGGPYLGPLPVAETGQNFFRVLKPCRLVDGICFITASGAATAQPHFLLISAGEITNVVGYCMSAALQPNSANRHVPALTFPALIDLYFRSVILSATVEAVTWALYFA